MDSTNMDELDYEEEEEILPEEETFVEEGVDEEAVEEESILTEYDEEDFQSGAVTTPDSSIPANSFEFKHSFGYDCHKFFNLCACDESVICWSAGSIITFLDVNTKQRWFRRSTTGGTVGSIVSYRKDPNYRIAVAEDREGDKEPLIILYLWPQMEINAVLREGTTNAYAIMDFSPDGELLASVGKEPDFNITIWNWKRHKILLRTSAFSFEVDAVMFSPYCPGQLTTAGSAHIKFWKMAVTFTGLKLKGELGRFGKTEICDVLGVLPMPDEKVLSGCDWGNILVWEAGLVKVEVTQKGRKKCHDAPIIQFMLSESRDEVITIGQDGFMKAWYWDTVDQADPPEEDPFVEINPVAETEVPGCKIMCLKHKQDEYWYAQDGNGGLWTVDLELDKIECEHTKIMTCHAGPIVKMIMLRTHPVLITAGQDGCLHIYDINTYALMAKYTYPAPITCMLYPPFDVDKTSRMLLVGFADGIMRTLLLHPARLETRDSRSMLDVRVHSAQTLHSEDSEHSDVIDLVSLLKPHAKSINQITINKRRTLLVTSSEDCTLFMYKLVLASETNNHFQLERLGFIETPNNVAYMTWKPDDETGRTILLCGQLGSLIEAVLPDVDVRKYSEITTFMLEFESFRESLVKKQYLRQRPFPEEDDLASLDEEAIRVRDEMLLDDEEYEEWQGEIQLMESESMLGSTLTWAKYSSDGVWVVQRGTGALLQVQLGGNSVVKFAPIPGAWTDSLTFLQFVCGGRFLLVGTDTGYIRVLRVPGPARDSPQFHHERWLAAQASLARALLGRRLAVPDTEPIPRVDFLDNYYLPMHDRYTGAITSLVFTVDGDVLFSCGKDGNIFSYDVHFPYILFPKPDIPEKEVEVKIERTKEPSTVDGELMSHEQLKQKEEFDKMMAIANAHKKRVRQLLADLTAEYNKLIKANRMLPCSQQIDITLDFRPLEFQEKELEDAKALTKRKLAHQLEASDLGLAKMINRNIIQLDVFPFSLRGISDTESIIRPLRHKNLSASFMEQLEEVYRKMAEAALRGRRTESVIRRAGTKRGSWGPPRVASFLLGLPLRRPYPLRKALADYRRRLRRHHMQFIEWSEHLSRKPDPKAMPPGAEEALKEAEATIGNKVLKVDPDYVANPAHNTQLRICLTRKEVYDRKHEFNEKVLELRQHKLNLVKKFKLIGDRLMEIRAEIPPKLAREPPKIPDIDEQLEFPEINLEVRAAVGAAGAAGAGAGAAGRARARPPTPRAALFPQPRLQPAKTHKFRSFAELRPLSASWEIIKARPDVESTPIETDIRERRIERHLYEQDRLLDEVKDDVRKFDARLVDLQRERIRVQENNQLLELHLYQLHREMNVLNQFEAHEDRLAGRVYAKLMQVKAVQEQIHDCENRIEEHFSNKEGLDEKVQEIHRQFKKLVADNKFADFLRRIFKKKYRPPRIRDDDDTSESSEDSSSSEEEDEGSLDSRDIGPIRLDLNVCPEGCDLDTFNDTYELRNKRHKYEQEMIEEDRLVELLRKDIDLHQKVKRQLTLQLDKRKNQLKEFMMEKQSCMNEIECVVVVRYQQLRAAVGAAAASPRGLSGAVVFPEAVLNRLRRRVLELQDEIEQQKLRHKVNRTHLFRMNVDLKFMAEREEEIRAQMRDVLTKKLGKPRKVDKVLDALLKQMARRHKYQMNFKTEPMAAQIRKWRARNSESEQKYLLALEEHSTRLRLAAALQADVVPIKACLLPSTTMPGGYQLEDYNRDVIRLKIVRSQQLHQIHELRGELRALRLQARPPARAAPPPPAPPAPLRSPLQLHVPRRPYKFNRKYFPINEANERRMKADINVMKLTFDCLDAMKISRDDATLLIKDMLNALPDVVAGVKTRYSVVDALVSSWMARTGGDPAQYKKHTKVFDAIAALADRLLRDHVHLMEGPTLETAQLMETLEDTLKEVVNVKEPLQDRIGPAIATLLFGGELDEVITEESLASLVRVLLSEEADELIMDDVDRLQAFNIVEDIKDCGITLPETDIIAVVAATLDCLRAQVVDPEEEQEIEEEADKLMEEAREYRDADERGGDENAEDGASSRRTSVWSRPRPRRPL